MYGRERETKRMQGDIEVSFEFEGPGGCPAWVMGEEVGENASREAEGRRGE